MIFATGDSHAHHSFLDIEGVTVFPPYGFQSVTMHKVGRDKLEFLDLKQAGIPSDSTVIFLFGEVDCRCHVKRQIEEKGRTMEEVIDTLVDNYVDCIRKNQILLPQLTIILASVVPPVRRLEYEALNGPLNNGFPFVGTDAERSAFTRYMNNRLAQHAKANDWTFLDIHSEYADVDGMFRYELSDKCVHVGNRAGVRKALQLAAVDVGDALYVRT